MVLTVLEKHGVLEVVDKGSSVANSFAFLLARIFDGRGLALPAPFPLFQCKQRFSLN